MGNLCFKSELILQNNDIPFFDLKGKTFNAKVVDVYDGDTCNVVFKLNGKYTKFKVRCKGYDTPEMKPPLNSDNREKIIKSAHKSKNYFISRVTNFKILSDIVYSKSELHDIFEKNNMIVKVECFGWDKYGRLLADIYDGNGNNINQDMIRLNYGYEYDGGTKRTFN